MVAVMLQALFSSDQRRYGGHVHFAGSVPCIIGALHPDPDQRFVADQLGNLISLLTGLEAMVFSSRMSKTRSHTTTATTTTVARWLVM